MWRLKCTSVCVCVCLYQSFTYRNEKCLRIILNQFLKATVLALHSFPYALLLGSKYTQDEFYPRFEKRHLPARKCEHVFLRKNKSKMKTIFCSVIYLFQCGKSNYEEPITLRPEPISFIKVIFPNLVLPEDEPQTFSSSADRAKLWATEIVSVLLLPKCIYCWNFNYNRN